MHTANHTNIHTLKKQVFLLKEQLATAISHTEELRQERDLLAWDLKVTCAREHASLGEISSMLSRAKLVEQKSNDVEATTKEIMQKLIDSQLAR